MENSDDEFTPEVAAELRRSAKEQDLRDLAPGFDDWWAKHGQSFVIPPGTDAGVAALAAARGGIAWPPRRRGGRPREYSYEFLVKVAGWAREGVVKGSVYEYVAATVVIRAFGVLAAILDEAVADRRLVTNPARGVKLPRKGKGEHSYLTDEQVWELAAQAGPDKGVVVLVLAYCGLRWGELAGLHVADIDMLRRRIHVRRNAVDVGGAVEVGTPKTHERRTVPLPRFLIGPLAAACRGKGRDDIVFPAARGGYAKPPGASTWFSGAVARCVTAGETARAEERTAHPERDPVTPVFPRITPHDLRHTAASLAVSAGANVKAVQKMLGHASAAMTLDTYADLFDRDAEAVADAHDQRLSNMRNVANLQPKAEGEPQTD
jgi:integrase